MTTWHIWTDGSCMTDGHGRSETPKGGVGYGGWAAILEYGSEGFVLRGRERSTTNVCMELRAVIDGLRAVPAGASVVVHTDSTVILAVRDRWQRGTLAHRDGVQFPRHVALWRELGREFDRLSVTVQLVVRGQPDPIHRRAHVLAGAEAKAGLHIANGRIPPKATPLDADDRRILAHKFRREVREWRDRQSRVTAKPLPSSR